MTPSEQAFTAYLATLPASARRNIEDSKARGESLSWDIWQAAWEASRERTISEVTITSNNYGPVAVTLTDKEHRIKRVLWERRDPYKELADDYFRSVE